MKSLYNRFSSNDDWVGVYKRGIKSTILLDFSIFERVIPSVFIYTWAIFESNTRWQYWIDWHEKFIYDASLKCLPTKFVSLVKKSFEINRYRWIII